MTTSQPCSHTEKACHYSCVALLAHFLLNSVCHLLTWVSVTFLARRTIQNDILPSAIFHIPPPAPFRCSNDVRLSRRGNRIPGDTHTCSCRVETLGRGSVHTETKKHHVGCEVLKALVLTSSCSCRVETLGRGSVHTETNTT
jgi:hypothetical protein